MSLVPIVSELIARGDLDELVRSVDELAARESWDELVVVRDRCRTASEEVGKQLWGVAHYADYRMALHGPAELAASVVIAGSGRFTLGPLTEVVAQHHRFDELAPHLDPTVAALVAQERVLRGEDLRDDPRASLEELGLPGVLQPWEPRFVLPSYHASERLDGDPPIGAGGAHGRSTHDRDVGTGGSPADAARVAGALGELVAPWHQESSGEVSTAAERTPDAAIRAVGADPSSLAPLGVSEAVAAMAYAAASGGVHGRRRGGAAGRAGAWWVGVLATSVSFPPEPDELEFGLEELSWWTFESPLVAGGWQLRLAVAGPQWAAAVAAYDLDDDRRVDGGEPGSRAT